MVGSRLTLRALNAQSTAVARVLCQVGVKQEGSITTVLLKTKVCWVWSQICFLVFFCFVLS